MQASEGAFSGPRRQAAEGEERSIPNLGTQILIAPGVIQTVISRRLTRTWLDWAEWVTRLLSKNRDVVDHPELRRFLGLLSGG
ncbi:MAG: hypothetical protein ACI9K5_003310 [Gammaproteobacteria bacterium]|jgi:hypothetical protein